MDSQDNEAGTPAPTGAVGPQPAVEAAVPAPGVTPPVMTASATPAPAMPAPAVPAPATSAPGMPAPAMPANAMQPPQPTMPYVPPAQFLYQPMPAMAPVSPAPPKVRMPKRHVIGAVASVAVGVAIAAATITTTVSAPAKAAPPAPSQSVDSAVRALWRTAPVDTLLPPTVSQNGGQYIRLAIAAPAGCDVLPKGFVDALAKAAPDTTCVKVLRATYSDVTQTVLTTVGIVVIGGPQPARDKVWRQWTPDSDSRDAHLMPSVYPAPGTVAAGFADGQRVTWNSQASNDGSYLVYAVSAFADGRAGSSDALLRSGTGKALAADSPPVQVTLDMLAALIKPFNDAAGKTS